MEHNQFSVMESGEAIIARREDSLKRKKADYEKAKLALQDFDISPFVGLLFGYAKGDPAESAVYVLAQCQALLTPYKKFCNTISRYEREADTLAKLKAPLQD